MTDDYSTKRPLPVTFLAAGVLIFGVVIGLGLWNSVELLQLNPAFPSLVTVVYLIARGAVFILASFVLSWGLWRGRAWASLIIRWGVLIYVFLFWFETFVLIPSENRGSNLLFSAGVSIFVILMTWLVLTRPSSRAFFGEKHD
jgi:hypothetical protein